MIINKVWVIILIMKLFFGGFFVIFVFWLVGNFYDVIKYYGINKNMKDWK